MIPDTVADSRIPIFKGIVMSIFMTILILWTVTDVSGQESCNQAKYLTQGMNWTDSSGDGIYEANESIIMRGADDMPDDPIPVNSWEWDFEANLSNVQIEATGQDQTYLHPNVSNITMWVRHGSTEFSIFQECQFTIETTFPPVPEPIPAPPDGFGIGSCPTGDVGFSIFLVTSMLTMSALAFVGMFSPAPILGIMLTIPIGLMGFYIIGCVNVLGWILIMLACMTLMVTLRKIIDMW